MQRRQGDLKPSEAHHPVQDHISALADSSQRAIARQQLSPWRQHLGKLLRTSGVGDRYTFGAQLVRLLGQQLHLRAGA
jgi:hypothetical protein